MFLGTTSRLLDQTYDVLKGQMNRSKEKCSGRFRGLRAHNSNSKNLFVYVTNADYDVALLSLNKARVFTK